uniref:Uncharacterized protein n=1 Tax=Avena sativa TaxID=4498 RepID=A0ACD5VPV2_AVESA
MHPRSIAEKVLAYIRMINLHLYKPTPSHGRETTASILKWSPPPAGTVMVNVDAAMFNQSRRMGVGVVIRDHTGKCLAACSEHHEEVATPEIAEAVAMRRALIFVAEEGLANVIVSSDCLSLVNRVSALVDDRSLCGPITHDIRQMVRSFNSCTFQHVKRGLNVLAHKLAKFSEFSVCSVWRGYSPDCIREDICNDILIM